MRIMAGTLAKGCYFEVFEHIVYDGYDIFLYSDETRSTTIDTALKLTEAEVGPWLINRQDY